MNTDIFSWAYVATVPHSTRKKISKFKYMARGCANSDWVGSEWSSPISLIGPPKVSNINILINHCYKLICTRCYRSIKTGEKLDGEKSERLVRASRRPVRADQIAYASGKYVPRRNADPRTIPCCSADGDYITGPPIKHPIQTDYQATWGITNAA